MALAGVLPLKDESFFETRIRPVLVEHCGECHLEGKAKGGLRLDSRELMLSGGDSGPAVDLNQPDASLLLRAVRYADPDLRMPPRHRLSAGTVEDLAEWVRRGLPDPRTAVASAKPVSDRPTEGEGVVAGAHWAVQPLDRHVGPPEPRPGRTATGLDRFIEAGWEKAGLVGANAADRRTWLRRVTLDLTGLPPTPAALAAFEADPWPGARERVVDALLASPHYGERWARWWLDVARYADTNGQDENKVMANAWRYRDWVVRAFNADLPFDRFALLQIAGDLLDEPGLEAERMDRLTATGFLVLGPKLLAEQDKPKLVMDIIDEQIDTVGRAFLGLTLGCARCHDHKFDPVSQKEYYALAGIFRGTRTMENLDFVSKFNERPVATADDRAAEQRHVAAIATAQSELHMAVAGADAVLVEQWVERLPRILAGETNGVPTALVARAAQQVAAFPGEASRARTLDAAGVRALRALTNEAGPVPGWRGAGFDARGTNRFELPFNEAAHPALTVSAWVRRQENPGKGETRRWIVSRGGNEWEDGHVGLVLDGDRVGAYVNVGGGVSNVVAAWGPKGGVPRGQWQILGAAIGDGRLRVYAEGREVGSAPLPVRLPASSRPWVVGMRPDGYVGFRGRLDGVRVWGRCLEPAEHQRLAQGEDVAGALLHADFEPGSEAVRETVERRRVAEWVWGEEGLLVPTAIPDRGRFYPAPGRERVQLAEATLARLRESAPPPLAVALAVAESSPTNLPVFIRGSHLNPGREPVPRGFPAWPGRIPAPPPGGATSGRLELARWLVHPENPLTARVLVNRVWAAHFGVGLVRTPENFGTRGEPPTHPDLLDWLARRFVEGRWSLKTLHREIVLSATYGMSAAADPDQAARDPDNRWLHRFPRQRLDSEMVRDAVLDVAGLLDRRIGGSVVGWKNDEYVPGDEEPFRIPRRTLYLPVVRDRQTDLATAFDGANPSVSTPQRSSTVVAPQALYLMNSPLVVGAARQLGVEAARLGGQVGLDWIHERVLGRAARAGERTAVQSWLEDPRLSRLTAEERWAALAQALLCSNEFLHRE